MELKRVGSTIEALKGLADGSIVLIGGFGRAGVPDALIDAVCTLAIRGLTIINNNAGYSQSGVAALLAAGCVRKLVCSFPWYEDAHVFRSLYTSGQVELELVPQGTLAERIRAGGAGIGGFLTRTGVGTELAEGKETVTRGGTSYLLELPLRADFALIRAHRVDTLGNLTYRKAARNFNPIMATAADVVVVEAAQEVEAGALDPECIVTPGLFVTRYVIVEGRSGA